MNKLLAEDYTSKDQDGTIKHRTQVVEENAGMIAAIKDEQLRHQS
jgi:hypothetical protein